MTVENHTGIPLADLSSITPHANAERENSATVAALVKMLPEYGWRYPIVCREADRVITAGHARYHAALDLGLNGAPVIFVAEDETMASRWRIADNRTQELASWVDDELARTLASLAEEDGTDLLGWEDDEIADMINGVDADLDRMAGPGGQYGGGGGGPLGSPQAGSAPPPAEGGRGEGGGDSGQGGPSEATSAPAVDVRAVNLFLKVDDHDEIMALIRGLGESYGTDNVTDTVVECLRRTGTE